MFTDEDIKKLTDYQLEVFKGVFVTQEDFKETTERIETSLATLQTSVDGFAKSKKTKDEDNLILNKRMKAAENWIDKASPKLGLKFDH